MSGIPDAPWVGLCREDYRSKCGYEEEEPRCKCDWCGEPIYDDEPYYEYGLDCICEQCAKRANEE